jgi:peptidoglycan-associated lipoprotein
MKGKKMRLQILSALAAAVLLAACSSDQPVETANQAGAGAGTGTANSAGVTSQYTPGSKGQFDAEVGNTVYFATDRYDLSGEAQAQLQKQAAWLQQYPASTMTVEGHCDERGTREYNLALGERRANSVANYLVALGLDKARISVISYGKERPICSESDEGCYSQNRRGVTAINQ